ncbi:MULTISPECIES: TonB-dependent siderophore receptor [unclassified Lysobacter]|uniref:TonB-dependent siderophore receptor n=1 Tax=unclassified Lysobacter TaxID=2635362 RepID=UPI001BEAA517|nr:MULTISPECIES: TonB-dependent siderophore receptor [unclassified Lysobacter]MBT2748613.1 TonB-dependent siderophore receptor [Lysobacter sp. ISL-42]MBT2751548.1 TonB-dependent siderophore receptor [Lysobacter sp. ISL-50]MBT2775742.1 TonB-dependent siderophore receptor [Lysobacter sp. ISL-54]MBT2782293.1 TonB-dependent siderophore receptor [Lysobacter sp. ISL-52]
MRNPLTTAVFPPLVLAVAAAAPASAQPSSGTDSATDLDAVTVYGRPLGRIPGETATKTGAALLETPFSVNVVPRELLDLRNVSNIGQAAETIGGVQRTIGFSGNQRFRIRGFQAISTLRDGFRQSVSQPEIELQGVESIEVLKGPASALYGRFEPGGVINFVSKRPKETFAAEASVTAGSDDYLRLGMDLGGRLTADGALLGRLNLAHEDAGSFRDGIDNRQSFVSPVLEWRPDDTTRLLARLEYLARDAAFDRGLGNNSLFLRVPPSRNYGEPFMRIGKEQWSGSLEFDRLLGADWRVRLGAFWSDVEVPHEKFFNYGFPLLDGTAISRNFVSYRERQKDATVQAELYGSLGTGPIRHRLLIGAERSIDRLAYLDGRIAYGNPIDLYRPVYGTKPRNYLDTGDSRYEFDTAALYLQDEMSWKRWRLLLGGRYERTDTLSFYTGGVDPAVTRRDRPFSPRAGLSYLATPDLSFYASWARSFRNEADAGLLERGIIPKPTRGEQAEIGVKSILMEGRMEATVSAFDLRKTDAVVSDPVDWNFVIQAGELRSRGIEAEVSMRPSDAWTLVASYAFTDASILEDTNASIVGNRLAGVPRHQASVWTSWAFEGALSGLTVGGGIFHGGKQAATTSNSFFLPSYTRLDLNARYAFGKHLDLLVNLDNVTDERYYITGGFSQLYPQAPRSVRLTLTRRW